MPAEMLTSTGRPEPRPTTKPVGRFGERLRDSLWVAWTPTFFFNWIAFFWIGFRARNARWLLWGFVYAIPFIAGMALTESDTLYDSWPGDVLVAAGFILGVVSIIHALRVRRTYIVQRRALLDRRASLDVYSRSPARRTLRSIGIVLLYLVVGSLLGGIVTLVVLFSDPCLPFCVADPNGYVRDGILNGIAIAGSLLYLALLVPAIWFWGTKHVWWIVPAGGIGIATLALVAVWQTIEHTGPPAYCYC